MSYLKFLTNVTTWQKNNLLGLDNTVMISSKRSIKAWIGMALTVCLLASMLLLNNFADNGWIKAEPHIGNYHHLVSPLQLEVIQHLYPDGSSISKHQAIVQVRAVDEKNYAEALQQLSSEASGIYFSMINAGTPAQELQPIAKVLRINDDHLYFFTVAEHHAQMFKAGQFVEIEVGQDKARGKVHSVIRAMQQGGSNIGIQFEYPYDVAVLHPLASIRLKLTQKPSNASALSVEES